MRKILRSKKAQITIFIIIGIILLFSSALIMYIKNRVTGTTPDAITIQKNLPDDLEGIRNYVESCIYTKGKEAVVILGSQGGYIYPQEYGVMGKTSDPTEASGVNPFPSIQNYIVPYWYYLKSPNNCEGSCQFASLRPSYSVMEEQISRYIQENLFYCLNDYSTYKNMGYTIEETIPLKVKTTITAKDISINADYEILAGQENKKKVSPGTVNLPVNLRSIYRFADKIITYEQNQSVFTTNTMNIILAYAADRLPSSGTLSFSDIFQAGRPYRWSFKKSKAIILDILPQYTRTIRVKNTLNFDMNELYDPNPVIQAAKLKMVIDTNSTEMFPYEVNFRYSSDWPAFIDINPKNGDTVEGKIVFDLGILPLMGLAIKKYEFKYDISYPIVGTISDPQAFYGEGYDFNFAFESNMRKNRPMKSDYAPFSVDGGKKGFECDEKQKVTGNITVNVTDGETLGPLSDASVAVFFGKSGCDIGITNEDGSSVEKYPKGFGEILVSKKPDYLSIKKLYAAKEGTVDNYNFTLYPIKEKEIVIKRMVMKKGCFNNDTSLFLGEWGFPNGTTPTDIIENETLSALFTRVTTSDSPDMLISAASYEFKNSKNVQTVRLAPGKYELKVMASLNKNISIPAQNKTYGNDDEEITISFDEVSSYPYNEGLLEFSNATFYFEVKAQDLYKNNYLEVYALVYDLDSVPLFCRSQEPNDFTPNPAANETLMRKTLLLIPKFKDFNNTAIYNDNCIGSDADTYGCGADAKTDTVADANMVTQ